MDFLFGKKKSLTVTINNVMHISFKHLININRKKSIKGLAPKSHRTADKKSIIKFLSAHWLMHVFIR